MANQAVYNLPHWVVTGGYPLKHKEGQLTGFRLYKYRDINPYSSTFNQRIEIEMEDLSIQIDDNPSWVEDTAEGVYWERYRDDRSYANNSYIQNYYTGYKRITYNNTNPNYQGVQSKYVREFDPDHCPLYITEPLWIYQEDSPLNTNKSEVLAVPVSEDNRETYEVFKVIDRNGIRNIAVYKEKDDCGFDINYTDYAIRKDMNPASSSYLYEERIYLYCYTKDNTDGKMKYLYRRPKDAKDNDIFIATEDAALGYGDDSEPYAIFRTISE